MATTRRPLRWGDLDLGGVVRLTAKVGGMTMILEGEYHGLDMVGSIPYAFVRTEDGEDMVPRDCVVKKQLLRPRPEPSDSAFDQLREWLGF